MEQVWKNAFRYAVVAAQLGESQLLAQLMTAEKENPNLRPNVIESFRKSISSGTGIGKIIQDKSQPIDIRAAVGLALSVVDSANLAVDEWEELADVMRRVAIDTTGAELRAAALACFTQWGLESPPVEVGERDANASWFENCIGLSMMRVPGGKFEYEIGNPRGRSRRSWKLDLKPFYVAATETTVAQYGEYAREIENPKYAPVQPESNWQPVEPMRGVNWYHAIEFCNWLSKKEGLAVCYIRSTGDQNGNKFPYNCDPSRGGYRLPSEAEWEYFCRAGRASTYSFGEERKFFSDFAVFATSTAAPITSRLPNRWGLFDCHGNVWEWCTDVYDRRSAKERLPTFEATNQFAQQVGDATIVGALRGGCFGNYADGIRAVSRTPSPLDKGCPIGGFRVVLGDSGDRPHKRRD